MLLGRRRRGLESLPQLECKRLWNGAAPAHTKRKNRCRTKHLTGASPSQTFEPVECGLEHFGEEYMELISQDSGATLKQQVGERFS